MLPEHDFKDFFDGQDAYSLPGKNTMVRINNNDPAKKEVIDSEKLLPLFWLNCALNPKL